MMVSIEDYENIVNQNSVFIDLNIAVKDFLYWCQQVDYGRDHLYSYVWDRYAITEINAENIGVTLYSIDRYEGRLNTDCYIQIPKVWFIDPKSARTEFLELKAAAKEARDKRVREIQEKSARDRAERELKTRKEDYERAKKLVENYEKENPQS